jgi:hypothetical protein
MGLEPEIVDAAAAAAVRRQVEDPEEHDRSLIAERLSWTPQQRLEANASFLRFSLRLRPEGPLIRD